MPHWITVQLMLLLLTVTPLLTTLIPIPFCSRRRRWRCITFICLPSLFTCCCYVYITIPHLFIPVVLLVCDTLLPYSDGHSGRCLDVTDLLTLRCCPDSVCCLPQRTYIHTTSLYVYTALNVRYVHYSGGVVIPWRWHWLLLTHDLLLLFIWFLLFRLGVMTCLLICWPIHCWYIQSRLLIVVIHLLLLLLLLTITGVVVVELHYGPFPTLLVLPLPRLLYDYCWYSDDRWRWPLLFPDHLRWQYFIIDEAQRYWEENCRYWWLGDCDDVLLFGVDDGDSGDISEELTHWPCCWYDHLMVMMIPFVVGDDPFIYLLLILTVLCVTIPCYYYYWRATDSGGDGYSTDLFLHWRALMMVWYRYCCSLLAQVLQWWPSPLHSVGICGVFCWYIYGDTTLPNLYGTHTPPPACIVDDDSSLPTSHTVVGGGRWAWRWFDFWWLRFTLGNFVVVTLTVVIPLLVVLTVPIYVTPTCSYRRFPTHYVTYTSLTGIPLICRFLVVVVRSLTLPFDLIFIDDVQWRYSQLLICYCCCSDDCIIPIWWLFIGVIVVPLHYSVIHYGDWNLQSVLLTFVGRIQCWPCWLLLIVDDLLVVVDGDDWRSYSVRFLFDVDDWPVAILTLPVFQLFWLLILLMCGIFIVLPCPIPFWWWLVPVLNGIVDHCYGRYWWWR